MRVWHAGHVRVVVTAIAVVATPLSSQTDYYDTDRNRPVRIEDARGTELGAVKVRLAPVTVEWTGGGVRRWEFDPEIAWGALPRTSLEVGLPIHMEDRPEEGRSARVSGVLISAFHSLNTETRTVPALAMRGDIRIDGEGAREVRPSLTAIATRTYSTARVHANLLVTGGGATGEGDPGASEVPPRWLAGVAIDRAFPLEAFLLTASVHVEDPIGERRAEWVAATGIRYQVNPYIGLDAGIKRRFGLESAWSATLGNAIHLAVPSFLRGSAACCPATSTTGGAR